MQANESFAVRNEKVVVAESAESRCRFFRAERFEIKEGAPAFYSDALLFLYSLFPVRNQIPNEALIASIFSAPAFSAAGSLSRLFTLEWTSQ